MNLEDFMPTHITDILIDANGPDEIRNKMPALWVSALECAQIAKAYGDAIEKVMTAEMNLQTDLDGQATAHKWEAMFTEWENTP